MPIWSRRSGSRKAPARTEPFSRSTRSCAESRQERSSRERQRTERRDEEGSGPARGGGPQLRRRRRNHKHAGSSGRTAPGAGASPRLGYELWNSYFSLLSSRRSRTALVWHAAKAGRAQNRAPEGVVCSKEVGFELHHPEPELPLSPRGALANSSTSFVNPAEQAPVGSCQRAHASCGCLEC